MISAGKRFCLVAPNELSSSNLISELEFELAADEDDDIGDSVLKVDACCCCAEFDILNWQLH